MSKTATFPSSMSWAKRVGAIKTQHSRLTELHNMLKDVQRYLQDGSYLIGNTSKQRLIWTTLFEYISLCEAMGWNRRNGYVRKMSGAKTVDTQTDFGFLINHMISYKEEYHLKNYKFTSIKRTAVRGKRQ